MFVLIRQYETCAHVIGIIPFFKQRADAYYSNRRRDRNEIRSTKLRLAAGRGKNKTNKQKTTTTKNQKKKKKTTTTKSRYADGEPVTHVGPYIIRLPNKVKPRWHQNHNVKTKTFGQRSFSYCAQSQWDSLLSDVRGIQFSRVVKTALKTHPC